MELTKNLTQTKIIKSLLAVILGSIALTISAKIKIPFYPVPMTMQTFVVLFLGVSLGYKIGLASVGLYLLEGIAGLPVFSNSPENLKIQAILQYPLTNINLRKPNQFYNLSLHLRITQQMSALSLELDKMEFLFLQR